MHQTSRLAGDLLRSSNLSHVSHAEAVGTLVHFVDNYLADCTGSEVKQFLYTWRRTHAFHRSADYIGLAQFCTGTKGKDGRALDRGTGLNKETAIIAKRGLEDKVPYFHRDAKDSKRTRYRIDIPDEVTAQLVEYSARRKPPTPTHNPVGVGNSDHPTPNVSENPTTHSMSSEYVKKNEYVGKSTPDTSNNDPHSQQGRPPSAELNNLRSVLERKLSGKLGCSPTDRLLSNILQRLKGAPNAQLEERIEQRYSAITSYGMVLNLADDCAATQHEWRKKPVGQSSSPASECDEFLRRYHELNSRTGS